MTTYGTIPTSTNPTPTPTPNLEFISRAKSHLRSTLSRRRPWSEFFALHSFSPPSSLSDSHLRSRSNLSHFRSNYAIAMLLLLFLSLLWHPISLIVFTSMMSAWIFLYFLRDSPLLLLGRVVDDRLVLLLLAVLTVVFLLLTKVTVNIVVSLVVGAVFVLSHALIRRTDDLPLPSDFEDEAGRRVVYAATGGLGERLPLKDAVGS